MRSDATIHFACEAKEVTRQVKSQQEISWFSERLSKHRVLQSREATACLGNDPSHDHRLLLGDLSLMLFVQDRAPSRYSSLVPAAHELFLSASKTCAQRQALALAASRPAAASGGRNTKLYALQHSSIPFSVNAHDLLRTFQHTGMRH
jgi:hypothetical protein